MPEIKHTFTGGKMNKDLDERLVPNGEYRDAMNIQVRTTDGDAAGTVQGVRGNTSIGSFTSVTNTTTGKKTKTIGSVTDEKNDNIYFFMAAPPTDNIILSNVFETVVFTDSIIEQNSDGTTSPVIIDEHTIITTPSIVFSEDSGVYSNNFELYDGIHFYRIKIQNNFILQKLKVGMTIELIDGDGVNKTPGMVIKDIDGVHVSIHKGFDLSGISSLLNTSAVWVKFSNPKVLNFDYDYNITAINVIDNLLLWTDGSSEPKKINIDRCKAGTQPPVQPEEYIINGDFEQIIQTGDNWQIANNVDSAAPLSFQSSVIPSVYQGAAVATPLDFLTNGDFNYDPASESSPFYGFWYATGNLALGTGDAPSVNWAGTIEGNSGVGGPYPEDYAIFFNNISTWDFIDSASAGDDATVDIVNGGEFRSTAFNLQVGQTYRLKVKYRMTTNNGLRLAINQTDGTQTQVYLNQNVGNTTDSFEYSGSVVDYVDFIVDGTGSCSAHFYASAAAPASGYVYDVSVENIVPENIQASNSVYLNGIQSWDNTAWTGGNGYFVYSMPVGTLTIGEIYEFSFDYIITNGTLNLRLWNMYEAGTAFAYYHDVALTTTSGPDANGIGTYTVNLIAVEDKTNIQFSGSGDNVGEALFGFIDNTSLQNVVQTDYSHTKLYVQDPTDLGSNTLIPITDLELYDFEGEKVDDNIKEEHITVIRKSPRRAPTLVLNSTDRGEGLTEVDITDSPFIFTAGDDESGQINVGDVNIFSHINFAQTIFRINDLLDFTTVYEDIDVGIFENIKITCRFVSYIGEDGDDTTESTSTIKVEITSWEGENLSSGLTNWNIALKQKPPLFELKLGRFAYRYKYEDGEYSSIGPWSEIAFLPGNFDYEAYKGYNLGMTNRVREIIIKDFVPFKTRPLDVSSVDIVYKTTDSPNIYVVKTISRGIDAEWDLFTPNSIDSTQKLSGQLSLTSETIHRVLSEDQALRSWDNVPRYAKAQEVTSNRLVFGNYVQGYNIQLPVGLVQEVIGESPDGFKTPSKSIKSIRDYKWGMVFGDKYGRETPVFTSGYTSGYADDYTSTTGDISLSKEYSSTKNYFRLKQQWDNPVNSNNSPPSWAEYIKYYVKETSNEYYNLVLNRWYYADKNGKTVWLSFQSTDRNKIDEETYLILKTKNGEAKPIKEETRYRVIAIENEAPDYVKTKHLRLGEIVAAPGDSGTSTTIWADGAAVVTTTEPINLLDTSTSYISIAYNQWDSLFGAGGPGVSELSRDRSKISVQIIGEDTDGVKKYSKWNEVTNWKGSGGDGISSAPSQFHIYYADSWGDDANMHARFVADASLDWSGGTVTGLTYRLAFKQEIIENKPEFDGRFFVKVEADPILESNVMLISDQSDKYTVSTTKSLSYVYSKSNTNPAASGGHAGEVWTYGDGDWYHGAFGVVDTWTSWSSGGNPDWDGLQVGSGTQYCGRVMSDAAGVGPHSYSNALDWAQTYPPSNYNQRFSKNSSQGTINWNYNNTSYTVDESTASLVIPDSIEEGFAYYAWKGPTNDFWNSRHTQKAGVPFIDEARAVGKASGSATTSIGNSLYAGQGLITGTISADLSNNIGLGGVTDPEIGMGAVMISIVGYTSWGDMPAGTQFFMDEMRTLGTQFRFSEDPDNQYKVIDTLDYTDIRNGYTWGIDYGSCQGCCNDGFIKVNTASGYNARMGSVIYFRKVDTATNQLLNEGINVDVWDPRGAVRHDGTQDLTVEVLRHQEFGGEALIFEKDLSIFETEPKKDVDLEIYYEGSDSIPLTLNNTNINDFAPIDCGVSVERSNYLSLQEVALPLATAGDIITNPPNRVANNAGKPNVFNNDIANFSQTSFYGTSDPIIHITNVASDGAVTDQANGIYVGDDIIFHHKNGDRLRSKITGFFTKNMYNGSVVASDGSADSSIYSPSWPITGKIKALISGTYNAASSGTNAWDPAAGDLLNTVSLTDPVWISSIEPGMQMVFADQGSGNNDVDLGVVVTAIDTTSGAETVTLTSSISEPFYFSKYETNGDIIRRNQTAFVEGAADGEEFDVVFIKPTAYYSIDKDVWKYHVDLNWSNCYSYGNGAESDRIRDDFNAPQIGNGVKASTTFSGYRKENKTSGLIYSGIYNSTSEVNNLNEFNMSQKIIKDLNPSYGSIQRLKTRDTDVIVLTEDKVLKVLSSKDALFNADGNPQLTATDKVLGTAMPFVGDYGISKNPESLAWDQYRMYFTDKQRGAVLRLSQDGLTPISNVGMKTWFRDNLKNTVKALGTFDVVSGEYNLTLTKDTSPYGFTSEDWICYANRYGDLLAAFGYDIDLLRNHYIDHGKNEGRIVACDTSLYEDVTVSFSEESKGWVSFKTFIPEAGGSVSGTYITAVENTIYKHYTNSLYNSFYGVNPATNSKYESSISVLFNDNPNVIKSFRSVNYEGSQSKVVQNTSDTNEFYNLENKSGWYVNSFETDKQSGKVPEFIEKEGKWFNKISGTTTTQANLDTGEFTVQGIGNPSSISSIYL